MICNRNSYKRDKKRGSMALPLMKPLRYLYRSALMVMLLPRSCHWRVMW